MSAKIINYSPIHFLLCHFSSKENTREIYLDIWDSHVPGRDLRKMPALGKAELNKELDLSARGASPRVRGLWFHGFGIWLQIDGRSNILSISTHEG